MTVYTLNYTCWCNCNTCDCVEEYSTLGEAWTEFNRVKAYFGENFTLTLDKLASREDYSGVTLLLKEFTDPDFYCPSCAALEEDLRESERDSEDPASYFEELLPATYRD